MLKKLGEIIMSVIAIYLILAILFVIYCATKGMAVNMAFNLLIKFPLAPIDTIIKLVENVISNV